MICPHCQKEITQQHEVHEIDEKLYHYRWADIGHTSCYWQEMEKQELLINGVHPMFTKQQLVSSITQAA